MQQLRSRWVQLLGGCGGRRDSGWLGSCGDAAARIWHAGQQQQRLDPPRRRQRAHQGMGHSAVGSVVALDQRPLLVGRRLQQVPDQACKGWARMQGYLLEALLLELAGQWRAGAVSSDQRCCSRRRHTPGSSFSTFCMLWVAHCRGRRETRRSAQQSEIGRWPPPLPPPAAAADAAQYGAAALSSMLLKGPILRTVHAPSTGADHDRPWQPPQHLKTPAAAQLQAPPRRRHVIRQCLARLTLDALPAAAIADTQRPTSPHRRAEGASPACSWDAVHLSGRFPSAHIVFSGHRKLGISTTVPLFVHCKAIYHSTSLSDELLSP